MPIKISKLQLFMLTLIMGLVMLLLPVVVSAGNGPSIRIGDPSCPKTGFNLFSLEYSYYDPEKVKCVTVRIFPPSTTETDPNFSATDTSLPGLDAIEFPTFLDVSQINSFSVWSYVALIVTLIFTLLIIYWVILLLRAAIAVMHSEGDPKTFESSRKKMLSVFMGVAFLVGFFVFINLVAAFLGIGTFTEWPRVFSLCRNGKYYYVLKLENPNMTDAQVSAACF